MRGFKTMYDYRGKVVGMVTAAIGAVLVLTQKVSPYIIFKNLDKAQHYYLSIWVTIAGLFFIAFGMERYEDERVKKIRAGAMQIVLGLIIGSMLAMSGVGIMIGGFDLSPDLVMLITGFYLVMYLIIFHIGLYSDNLWQYNADEIPVGENIRKNSWVPMLLALVMLGVMLLMRKLF